MLNVNKTGQVLSLLLMTILLADFLANVWVSPGAAKKSLKIDSWDKSLLTKVDNFQLQPVNLVFGLKAEPDPEELRRQKEREEAERIARENQEQQVQSLDVLTLGEKNIRLFGISIYREGKHAIFSINAPNVSDEAYKLALNESIDIEKGKTKIVLDEIRSDSVKLIVTDNTGQNLAEFNLVIFNYDI